MGSLTSLPEIAGLSQLPAEKQIQVLDALFEPSPSLHTVALPWLSATSFNSYNELIDICQSQFSLLASDSSTGSRSVLHSILGSHPRLGAKKVDSAQSAAEQSQLQSGGDGSELAALNAEYENQFPGLRYVVFVNGRGRPEIMADMKTRISRADFALEEQAAIQAMCDIAKDRASKLQTAGL